MLLCDNQEEIDYFWDKLSFVPEAGQCGWLKDKFGLSWKSVPIGTNEILMNGRAEQIKRVTELLTEEQYWELQKLGNFDTKTSSMVKTPSDIRKLGGALARFVKNSKLVTAGAEIYEFNGNTYKVSNTSTINLNDEAVSIKLVVN